MTPSILVTGGTGFIGRHLLAQLRKEGKNVIAYKEDVRRPFSVKEDISCIIHVAGIFSPRETNKEREVYETNILGTLNALECAREKKAKVIFASTCGIYGDQEKDAADEKHKLKPYNAYTRSKVMAEQLCEAYRQDYQVPSVVLRLFNCYGPGQNKKFIIPMLIEALKTRESIDLHLSKTTRDFVDVDDVIQAIIKAMSYKGKETTFNIGTGKSWTTEEVIHLIEKISKEKINYTFHESTKVVIKKSKANNERARKELGWSPKISLEEGIKKILAFR